MEEPCSITTVLAWIFHFFAIRFWLLSFGFFWRVSHNLDNRLFWLNFKNSRISENSSCAK